MTSGPPRRRVSTDSLDLVAITADDGAALYDLHQDEGIAQWYGGPWSRAESDRAARERAQEWESREYGKWLAYDRNTGDLVGRGGMSRRTYADVDCLELGWALRQRHWGRGLATEIGRASLDVAFGALRAADVVAVTESHNLASRAVMDRLGLAYRQDFADVGLVPGRDGVWPGARFVMYGIRARSWWAPQSPHSAE